MDIKVTAAIALTLMVAVPIGLGYCLNIDEVEKEIWISSGEPVNLSQSLYNGAIDTYKPYTGPYNNLFGIFYDAQSNGKFGLAQLNYVTVNDTYSSIPVYGEGTMISVISDGSYISISDYTNSDSYELAWNSNKASDIRYVQNGVEWGIHQTGISGDGGISTNLVKNGSTITLSTNGTIINDVTSVRVSLVSGQELQITPLNVMIGYAQPADGWYIDANTSMYLQTPTSNFIDGRLLIEIPDNSSDVYISTNQNHTPNYLQISKLSTGIVVAESFINGSSADYETIGETDIIMVEIDYLTDVYTVSSVSYWPALGEQPQVINTRELHRDITYGKLSTFEPSKSNIRFRMDATKILDSVLYTASNKTITMTDYKPSWSNWELKFSDVLMPGSSIQFGSNVFTISGNDAVISMGYRVPLNELVLSCRYDSTDNNYDLYVNNRFVGTWNYAYQPNVILNGEWGAKWTANEIIQTTEIVPNTWIPGHMGINMSEAALIGVGTCAALFIVLGMAGKMSGKKAAILGLICGSGALIFFILM